MSKPDTLQDLARPANWPRMRPRFSVDVECDAAQVMKALRSGVERGAERVEGRFSDRHGVLSVPAGEQRFWSTQLGLTVEPVDEARTMTRVLGVFSPHPEIWTAYVFAIGTLCVLGVFGVMYAIVQLSMGHAPWALVVSLVAVLLALLAYTSTLVGQGLALGEMYQLRSHVDDCLEAAVAAARRTPATARESAQL